MKNIPALIAFDLDDTLAPSKTEVPENLLDLLLDLFPLTTVAVISGGNYEQFTEQLLKPLEKRAHEKDTPEDIFDELYLLPTCGTRFYKRDNKKWAPLYEENLSLEERASAAQALEQEAMRLGIWEGLAWGEIIEDRGSQVTFSALGQRAPVEAKSVWDPKNVKKNALRDAVAARLPELEVRSGGSTSVDVTRKGIDKAYGMKKLQEHTNIDLYDMLFVGDRLDSDGNDYPVLAMGVPCKAVTDWEETAKYLQHLLGKL